VYKRVRVRACVCGLRRRATVSILLVGENGDSAVRVLRPDERAGAVAAVCVYCARHGRCVYRELRARLDV